MDGIMFPTRVTVPLDDFAQHDKSVMLDPLLTQPKPIVPPQP